MWKVNSPGIEIFSNSIARWWNAPSNFRNLVTFETTWWQNRSLDPDVCLVKFYIIFQWMKKMFSRRNPANYFLIFNVEFGSTVSIARLLTQGCGAGEKNLRCLELKPEPKSWVPCPQPCSSCVITGWLASTACRVWSVCDVFSQCESLSWQIEVRVRVGDRG